MKYCIIVNDKIKYEFSTQLEAETKLNKTKNSRLVIIPDIAIGLKIYSNTPNSTNIRFIGEIISESDSLWFTKKSEDQLILDPWLKDNFEDKYINGIFVVGE